MILIYMDLDFTIPQELFARRLFYSFFPLVRRMDMYTWCQETYDVKTKVLCYVLVLHLFL